MRGLPWYDELIAEIQALPQAMRLTLADAASAQWMESSLRFAARPGAGNPLGVAMCSSA